MEKGTIYGDFYKASEEVLNCWKLKISNDKKKQVTKVTDSENSI
ncbi:hypothetical protein [Acinetobacter baumannii]|nr:hypothetical protein [Acinetobacter baumannii]MDP7914068.1 hypothetical protein [Acinetobacter baumannii]